MRMCSVIPGSRKKVIMADTNPQIPVDAVGEPVNPIAQFTSHPKAGALVDRRVRERKWTDSS